MCRKLATELIKHEQHFRRKCDICPEDLIDSWYQSSPTKIDSTHREDQCLELLDLPTKRNCFYLGVGASQGTPFPLLDSIIEQVLPAFLKCTNNRVVGGVEFKS